MKATTWHYDVTWYMKQPVSTHEVLLEALEEASETLNLQKVNVQTQTLQFQIEASEALNINKVMKALFKKFLKCLNKRPEGNKENWEEEMTIMTACHGKEDERLSKLIASIDEVAYYDLDEAFSGDLQGFKNYLMGRNLTLLEQGERLILIDGEALNKEINLNCFACTKLHQYGCCCGSPCDFSEKNRENFDRHLLNIEEAIKAIDEAYYKEWIEKDGLLMANGRIREMDGHCSLLVHHEGVYKCIAHKYALEHNLPIYDLCPLSCLMYPLELLELITDKNKEILLMTSVLEEDFAKEYGRWGSYESLEVELRCIQKEKHNEVFKKEDYQPVYKVNEGLIKHELGHKIYQSISKLLK